jgi:hypothetical protein
LIAGLDHKFLCYSLRCDPRAFDGLEAALAVDPDFLAGRGYPEDMVKKFDEVMMREYGVDPVKIWFRETESIDEPLPWDHLSTGVEKKWLWKAWEKAKSYKGNYHCFSGCTNCGACLSKEDKNQLVKHEEDPSITAGAINPIKIARTERLVALVELSDDHRFVFAQSREHELRRAFRLLKIPLNPKVQFTMEALEVNRHIGGMDLVEITESEPWGFPVSERFEDVNKMLRTFKFTGEAFQQIGSKAKLYLHFGSTLYDVEFFKDPASEEELHNIIKKFHASEEFWTRCETLMPQSPEGAFQGEDLDGKPLIKHLFPTHRDDKGRLHLLVHIDRSALSANDILSNLFNEGRGWISWAPNTITRRRMVFAPTSDADVASCWECDAPEYSDYMFTHELGGCLSCAQSAYLESGVLGGEITIEERSAGKL